MLLGSITVIAFIAALLYFIRNKADRRTSHKHPKTKPVNKHNPSHCVETHHHNKCCKAVKTLHGKRFLAADAPSLPVKGCNQEHCHCDYVHHEDRRVEVRRSDVGIQHDMYGQNGEVEHREKEHHGRRKTD